MFCEQVSVLSVANDSTTGVPAICGNAQNPQCLYTFAADATPAITSVSVSERATNTGTLIIEVWQHVDGRTNAHCRY
jgi:hypothetical protein